MRFPDKDKIDRIVALLPTVSPDNFGDVFAKAIQIRKEITDQDALRVAELPLSELRQVAGRAQDGWTLFTDPTLPSKTLRDGETLQLIGLERSLHELCYCCERVQESADKTWGGSSPTRFYLNSIYYYVTSLFLVDKNKPSHKGLPMGGTSIRVLHPLGLSSLLVPVDHILKRPMGKAHRVGDTIRKLRNKYLVHGDFSTKQLEDLVVDTEMRDPVKREQLSVSIWDLFYEVLLLDLKLIAILSKINPDVEAIVNRYVNSQKT